MPFWNLFYTLDSSSFLWLLKTAKGRASQVALVVKNPPANAGDLRDEGSITGSGSSPWVGNGNPLQYSCLENLMDREAWWATVHGVAESWTQLSMSMNKLSRWGSCCCPTDHHMSSKAVLLVYLPGMPWSCPKRVIQVVWHVPCMGL